MTSMTDADLEQLLLHVALPPLRLGVRVTGHYFGSMITLLLHLLRLFPFLFRGHRQLALENLALRQQLAVHRRAIVRPRLR